MTTEPPTHLLHCLTQVYTTQLYTGDDVDGKDYHTVCGLSRDDFVAIRADRTHPPFPTAYPAGEFLNYVKELEQGCSTLYNKHTTCPACLNHPDLPLYVLADI